MTDERWQQIEAILHSALEIESSVERERLIADACFGDGELRAAVERLIAADDDAGRFIESPAWTDSGMLGTALKKSFKDAFGKQLSGESENSSDEAGDLIGKNLGVFKLEKELGRGGMGTVFLATRVDGEFRQRAAVKLIKRGMDTDFIVKRFRHERQILAALNHPNIAGLIGGGTTPDGLPYFVMEYVEGKPLYRFCDERKLGTTERLLLFGRLCDAVEAAHRLKVVHRDLKPSNILVKADGTPKLLDFGIAKILDSDLASATLEPTATAMRMMTPEYASPEQVSGLPVTFASDIYSLGVLLYELVTGHRPYRLRSRALHEIHRAVCEEIPDAPSESLTSEDNLVPTAAGEKDKVETMTLEVVFRSRNTDFENLRRELAGDLDKIILKALRKNPADRYQSAAELAADIARYLEKLPVAAESFAPEPERLSAASATGEAKESIAILPFKTLGVAASGGGVSNTDSEEFLGIGLADALITRLSGVPRLIVRPTSSVLGFGAADENNPFAAGQKLAVKFVVDGSIRRAGERIRVTVQLLSVGEKATVWAQTFDEQFTDVLSLEDSISERVAGSLVPRLTGAEEKQLHKRGTDSPEAYEAFMRGRFHWNQFTPAAFPKARAAFESAIGHDPDFAPAYVGIADFYNWMNVYGLIPSQQALAEAERYALRAVQLDGTLGEAYTALSFVTRSRRRWAEAEQQTLEAIRLMPDYYHAHECYCDQLIATGRIEEGIREAIIAERLAPLSLRTKTMVAFAFYQAHHFEKALERGQEMFDLDKNYPQAYLQCGLALYGLRRFDEALSYIQKFDEMIPHSAFVKYQLCHVFAAAGQSGEARQVLEEMKRLAAETYVKPFFLGVAHVAVGQTDEAFGFFEQSFIEDDPWMLWLGTHPMLENIRTDVRYNHLLDRTNNPLAERFKKRPFEIT